MKTKDNSKDDDYRACGGRKHLAPLEKYSEYSLFSISKNDVHLSLGYHVIPVVFCLHFLFCYAVTDKLCNIHVQGDFCEGNGCELPCECPPGSVDNNRGLGLCVGEEGNAVECAIPLHTRTRAHTHAHAHAHTHVRTHIQTHCTCTTRGPLSCRRGKGARRVATQKTRLDAKPAYVSKPLNPCALTK